MEGIYTKQYSEGDFWLTKERTLGNYVTTVHILVKMPAQKTAKEQKGGSRMSVILKDMKTEEFGKHSTFKDF